MGLPAGVQQHESKDVTNGYGIGHPGSTSTYGAWRDGNVMGDTFDAETTHAIQHAGKGEVERQQDGAELRATAPSATHGAFSAAMEGGLAQL